MQSGNTYFVKFETQVWIRFQEPAGAREIEFLRVHYHWRSDNNQMQAGNQAQYIASALTEYESGINTRWTPKETQGFLTLHEGHLYISAVEDLLNERPVAVLHVGNCSNNEVSEARAALVQAGFTDYMHSSSLDFPEEYEASHHAVDSLLRTLGIR